MRKAARLLAPSLGMATAAVTIVVGLATNLAIAPRTEAGEEMSKEILAVLTRKQGFACTNPSHAERDKESSKPNDAMWVLTCENATYRVRLVPKMAAQVEVVP